MPLLQSDMEEDELDIIIVGAGLSGINAAYRLRQRLPEAKFAIIEARDVIGGTWSFFQYPGFRCDAPMTTFGFRWHPWPHDKRIAKAELILEYIKDAMRTHGLDKFVRLGHKLTSANWSTDEQRWSLNILDRAGGSSKIMKAPMVFNCAGYWSYDNPLQTVIPGIGNFQGEVVHPHFWPKGLDYSDKKVVVIGSGATAITLIPALAEKAADVVMLQRSPSYVFSLSSESRFDKFLKRILPLTWVHAICWWRDMLVQIIFTHFITAFPKRGRAWIDSAMAKQLPPGYPVDIHFNPRYDPLKQRLCFCPDGDFFESIQRPNCRIVTAEIQTVTETGIITKDGQFLPADIIATATGLDVIALGGTEITVDGKLVNVGERYLWRACVLEGVPNAFTFMGYIQQSWTPGVDCVAEIAINILKQMKKIGATSFVPVMPGDRNKIPKLSSITASSTYMQKARDKSRVPLVTRQGPWYGHETWVKDYWGTLFGSVTVDMKYTIPGKDKSV
jgi:cation diffusion facilitator CzcD-associated flavoprotein CzcO